MELLYCSVSTSVYLHQVSIIVNVTEGLYGVQYARISLNIAKLETTMVAKSQEAISGENEQSTLTIN